MPLTLVSETSTTLAAALAADPFYVAVVPAHHPGSAGYQAALTAYFAYSLGEGEALGRVVRLADITLGAAIWTLPQPAARREHAKHAKNDFLAQTVGAAGLDRYHTIVTFMAAAAVPLVADDAWYLSIIGVAPAQQGQRIGERLLQPTLAQADQARAVCYLETFNERSLRFYQRLGFQPVLDTVEPVTAARYWLLVRPGSSAI